MQSIFVVAVSLERQQQRAESTAESLSLWILLSADFDSLCFFVCCVCRYIFLGTISHYIIYVYSVYIYIHMYVYV